MTDAQLYTSNRTFYPLEVNAENHDQLRTLGMTQSSFEANTMGATMTAVIDATMPQIVDILAEADFANAYTAVPAG